MAMNPLKGNIGDLLEKEGKKLVKGGILGDDVDKKLLKKRKKVKSKREVEKKHKRFKGERDRGRKYEVDGVELEGVDEGDVLAGKAFQARVSGF